MFSRLPGFIPPPTYTGQASHPALEGHSTQAQSGQSALQHSLVEPELRTPRRDVLPSRIRVGNRLFNLGQLQHGIDEPQKAHLLAALQPAPVQLNPRIMEPDEHGVLSYEAHYPDQQHIADPRRMLVTLQVDNRGNLHGIEATPAQYGMDPHLMQQLSTPLLSARFHPASVAATSLGQQALSQLHDDPMEVDPPENAPISGLRTGSFVALGGQRYQAVKTSDNGFTLSLRDSSASQRRATLLEKAAQSPAEGYSEQEKTHANQELTTAKNNLLEHYPEQRAILAQQTAHLAKRLLKPGSEMRSQMVDALSHYQAPDGDHVLMNIALQGHKTLADYLKSVDPETYKTDEDVDDFCEHFISSYHYGEYEPADLKSRFENDIHDDIHPLDHFLRSGKNINDVAVVKGLKSNMNMENSTAIDTTSFVGAFLNREKIHYNSFLSTSSDWVESAKFTGRPRSNREAQVAVDVHDDSPSSLAQRGRLLQELESETTRDDNASIMMLLHCKNAKGAVVDSHTLGLGDTLSIDEQEILLAPNHIVTPQKVIRTQDGYVLIGEVTHASEHR